MDLLGAKVLVTGGAGFIGSHLSDSLLRLGCEVVIYDNFDDFYTGKEENIRLNLVNSKFRLVKGSILEPEKLSAAMDGVSVVFHLAAQAGVRYCIDNPRKAHEVNVTGTLNVLLAAKKNAVQKVVYASSSSVYGNPIRVPMEEGHPQDPTNLYGATKLAAEKYCLSFQKTYGLKVVCLRYFSVYGPRGRPDQVLASFAKNITQGHPPRIFGDGSQSRDFTFVSDAVSATVMSAMDDQVNGEVINIGYGKDFPINYAAEKIAEYLDKDLQPEFAEAYEGDFPRTICSNSKALRLLRWKPTVSFERGLEAYLDWFTSKNEAVREALFS